MEYEKCYVFNPENARSPKRRRTEPQGLQASWRLRQQAYRRAWQAQRNRIDEKVETLNATTVKDILTFLDECTAVQSSDRIPTGLVLTGPRSTLCTTIGTKLLENDQKSKHRIFTSISANAAPNLKAALKTILQRATSRTIEDEDDETDAAPTSRKGPKLLNYDLRILHDYVKEHRIQQVVLSLEDSEAYDNDTLSELIQQLGFWNDRIPFVLLLNVATSVDFLQQKLSKAAVRCLEGKLFDAAVSADEVERIFETLTDSTNDLWLGPGLASMLLEQQQDYIQSIDSLVDGMQYAFMSCFYANALSIFLDPPASSSDISEDHFEALRTLPSVQLYAKRLLDEGQTSPVRSLLDSDHDLLQLVKHSIAQGRLALAEAMAATNVLRAVQANLPNTQPSAKPTLYLQVMSGKLAASPMLRSLLLSIRKAPSNIAKDVMSSISQLEHPVDLVEATQALSEELEGLLQEQGETGQPLRSEDDLKNSTVRTTVVAQKVELSKQKSTLSKQDAAYTATLRRFSELLGSYFTEKFIDPKQLLMHEIFTYDLKSPHREVFTARPRHAVERALATPHDYLDCDCCTPTKDDEAEATLSASQPATAVLYQLYLESGSLINTYDLWSAFQAVIGDTQKDEQTTMALFQRALAELHHLGLVKGTRRRVDHIEKVAWRGL